MNANVTVSSLFFDKVAPTLRELRGERSLRDVAQDLGISEDALSAYEAGTRIPRDSIKVRIAKYYGSGEVDPRVVRADGIVKEYEHLYKTSGGILVDLEKSRALMRAFNRIRDDYMRDGYGLEYSWIFAMTEIYEAGIRAGKREDRARRKPQNH